MWHADLVTFEGGQGQLPIDEEDVAFEVCDDQIATPTCACWDVYLLKEEKGFNFECIKWTYANIKDSHSPTVLKTTYNEVQIIK